MREEKKLMDKWSFCYKNKQLNGWVEKQMNGWME